MEKELGGKKRKVWPVGGFIGLLIAAAIIFLVIPLFSSSFYTHLALQSCFTLMILSIIYTFNRLSFLWMLCFALVLPFIVFDLYSTFNHSLYGMIAAYGFYCIFLSITIYLLAQRVLTSPAIDTDLIFGTLAIYFLTGILWAKLYFLNDALFPGSFHGITHLDLKLGSLADGYRNQFDFLYYSFCTLTTLGMGDIAPVHRLAKSLTMLEVIFGQLYVATIVAKTISVWRR